MAIPVYVPCSPVDLLAEAVDLARAAERLTRAGADPATAVRLRVLADDLRAVTRAVEERLPTPTPSDRGHLHIDRPAPGTVRVRGAGPVAEGDLVRTALLDVATRGSARASPTGAQLWDALVGLARHGLDPPAALPSPLSLVGRAGR